MSYKRPEGLHFPKSFYGVGTLEAYVPGSVHPVFLLTKLTAF